MFHEIEREILYLFTTLKKLSFYCAPGEELVNIFFHIGKFQSRIDMHIII